MLQLLQQMLTKYLKVEFEHAVSSLSTDTTGTNQLRPRIM